MANECSPKTNPNGVVRLLRGGYPLKVRHVVVRGVPVDMVNFVDRTRGRSYESSCHKAVDRVASPGLIECNPDVTTSPLANAAP